MPYVSDSARLRHLRGSVPTNAGELNYAITVLIRDYWTESSQSYRDINEVVGVLEAAKLEFYRRVAVPYEDRKIEENGDVYF